MRSFGPVMVDVRSPAWVVAGLAGAGAVAGSFALGGRTPRFVAGPAYGLFRDAMPGALMAWAIEHLGTLAQPLSFLPVLVLTVLAFVLLARVAIAAGRGSRVPYTAAVAAGAASWLLSVVLTGALVASLGAALPPLVVLLAAERRWRVPSDRPTQQSRRSVLASVGALAGFTGLSLARGWTITGARQGPLSEILDGEAQREADWLLALAEDRSLGAGGLEPLVSEDFYQVDINAVNPDPTADRWSLSVTGAVDESLELDYEDLLAMPMEHRFVTLRCVSDNVDGRQLDGALWTGVPVADLLDRAGVQGDYVMLRSVDGYHVGFPLDALEPGLLAVGMNGRILPRGHGYPVRALAPGHWGETNGKWLTEIEVLADEQKGYWEKKGWHGTGPVNTIAKLYEEDVTHLDDGRVLLAGHAYAGTRGVARVEVSTDGGETWDEADLSERLPGRLDVGGGVEDSGVATDAWRQWVYRFEPTRDEHEVVVRATDGEGDIQPREHSRPFPSGATGWVSLTVDG